VIRLPPLTLPGYNRAVKFSTSLPRTLLAALIALSAAWLAGCEQMQLGYYRTPGNLPTVSVEAAQDASPLPADTVTPSPPATIPTLATVTPSPTLTITPSPTRTPVVCTDTQGEIVEESFVSQLTGGTFHYRVYLPPCYAASERRYPVLYMLHGLGAGMDDSQWDRMGLDEAADQGIAQGVLAPMIIVMPNGNDADHAQNHGPSPYPEVIVGELMPAIQEQYCTWNLPEMRAIGGLSRGGYWAYWVAFSYPDLFGKVGGHSPYFFQPDYPTDKNPNNLVDTAPGIEGLEMYFDHGPQDYDQVIGGVAQFIDRLSRRGIEVTYVQNPSGGHTEEYWSSHVADYLTFYTQGWPRDRGALPSCHAPD
jgi:enterochelin esterase-like enzyme